jgi:hypothetical protein
MPSITLSWDPAGLVMPVIVGPDANTIRSLQQAGQPIPPIVEVRGLIDSGSDVCVISPFLVQHFGLQPIWSLPTQTTIGTTPVQLYEVSLVVVGPARLSGPMLVRSTLQVMGATHPFSNQIEVLIGLDILRDCRLDSDGPNQVFTLAF